jgi:hypothetical protein
MVRLKALVVAGDGVEDFRDLLAIGRTEAKRLLRTHVNVKDILYSAKCGVHIIVFEMPEKVVADSPKDEKVRPKRAGLGLKPNSWEYQVKVRGS